MTTESATWERSAERQVGHVYADITIRNRRDEADAERRLLSEEAVREVRLNRVLVDTGATMLCLPAPVIVELGLSFMREVPIRTASGPSRARVFQDAKLIVEGRPGNFECMELPEGAEPLLGVLPLEALGIEPDIMNHRLRLLPEEPGNTHFLVM